MYGIRRIYLWLACCVFGLQIPYTVLAQVLTLTRQGSTNVFDYSWSLPKTIPNNGSTPGAFYEVFIYHVAEGTALTPPHLYHLGYTTLFHAGSSLSTIKSGSGSVTLPLGRTLYAFTQSMTYGVTPTTSIAHTLTGYPYSATVAHCAKLSTTFDTATEFPLYYRVSKFDSEVGDFVEVEQWVVPAGTSGPYLKAFGPFDSPGDLLIEHLKFIVHVQDPSTGTWWKPALGFTTVPGDWKSLGFLRVTPCQNNEPSDNVTPPAPTPGKPDPTDPEKAIPDDANTQTPSSPSKGAGGAKVTGPVWSSPPSSSPVSDATYKEGVDNIVAEQRAMNARIDEASSLGAASTDGNGKGDGTDSAAASTEQAFNTAQAIPVFSPSPAGQSMLSITLPGHGVINLDPASDPTASTLCAFVRNVISWIVLLIYTWFAWGEFKTLCNLLTISQQAQGNPVIAGTGAQATALAAAVAITVLIISFPAIYWAYLDMPSVLSSNPFAGATGVLSGVSLYLLYLVVPVALILTLISQAFALRKFGLITAMTIATAIRFVVP